MTALAPAIQEACTLIAKQLSDGPRTLNELHDWWCKEREGDPGELRQAQAFLIRGGLVEARAVGKVKLLCLPGDQRKLPSEAAAAAKSDRARDAAEEPPAPPAGEDDDEDLEDDAPALSTLRTEAERRQVDQAKLHAPRPQTWTPGSKPRAPGDRDVKPANAMQPPRFSKPGAPASMSRPTVASSDFPVSNEARKEETTSIASPAPAKSEEPPATIGGMLQQMREDVVTAEEAARMLNTTRAALRFRSKRATTPLMPLPAAAGAKRRAQVLYKRADVEAELERIGKVNTERLGRPQPGSPAPIDPELRAQLVTTNEAAELLGIKPHGIHKLVERKQLIVAARENIGGRIWTLFRRDDIAKIIAARAAARAAAEVVDATPASSSATAPPVEPEAPREDLPSGRLEVKDFFAPNPPPTFSGFEPDRVPTHADVLDDLHRRVRDLEAPRAVGGEVLELLVAPTTLRLLEQLHASGLFGVTVADVALGLIYEGLRAHREWIK